jgi:hypothetical protein
MTPTKKTRVRCCKFEALAQGKVWVFRWDPKKQLLQGWQKRTRLKRSISGDVLADAISGQFDLFNAKAVPPAAQKVYKVTNEVCPLSAAA